MRKKSMKRIIVLTSMLLSISLVSCVVYWFGVGVLVFSSGGFAVFLKKVNYTTPIVWQTKSKLSKGEFITDEVLAIEIRRILGNYDCALEDEIGIYQNEWAKSYTIIDYNGDVNPGRVLYVNASGNLGINLKKFNDIKAMMDIWIFTIEHQMAEEIEGISYYFLESGKMGRSTQINISKKQFLRFYQNASVEEFSHKEKIDTLTKLWVDKVNYTRPHSQVDVSAM